MKVKVKSHKRNGKVVKSHSRELTKPSWDSKAFGHRGMTLGQDSQSIDNFPKY